MGIIFQLTRPATIIKSACLGDALKTSLPNLDISNLLAPALIISIAQHARPIETGQIENLRNQLIAESSFVTDIPASSGIPPIV
jgi:hypothetical protein